MSSIKRPATIKDVANAAGVSIATVSKFINGQQRFSAPVEAKLTEVIATLGYRINHQARSMVTGKTRTLGLAILDVRNPHFANIVKGANRVALAHDYNLLVVDLEERPDHERHLLEALSGRVDGLIVSSRVPDEAISWLSDIGKPVVFFGQLQREGVHCVRTDGHSAAGMIGRHLLELGRKRIAYLGFPRARWNAEREAGLREVLTQAGLELAVHAVESPTLEGGQLACAGLLMGGVRPDAVVAYNDLIAIGLMHEAQALGLRIPTDVAVAGFDNIPVSRFMHPALTTVDMRSESQGEAAMQLLLEVIGGKEDAANLLFEPRLVSRASTASR